MMTPSSPDGPLSPVREVESWLSDLFRVPVTAAAGVEVRGATMDDSVVVAASAPGSELYGSAPAAERRVRRYTVCREVAYGGTATVHLGVLDGAAGFRRPVAIKRIRHGLPKERQLTSALRREALLGCHIRHPNVVPILDLVEADGELLLVMEYVLGETLARVQRAGGRLPVPIIVAIMSGVLRGLHAAHIATDDSEEPLKIVHRDVSPQNVLVGADGIARIIDFGVAKAVSTEPTSVGYVKGKIGYFAPEQFLDEPLDARTDVFAAGIVLWEALAGRRLFQERNPIEGVLRFLSQGVEPACRFNPEVPRALDAVLARALQRSPEGRFASAEEFADALEAAVRPASPGEVARYLENTAGIALETQRALLAGMQAPGRRDAVMPPLASAHGSISFPAISGARSPDDEATVVQRPEPQRVGLLSAVDYNDTTDVQTRPGPFESDEPSAFSDVTRADPAPRQPSALRDILASWRVLGFGLVLGAVIGAVVSRQLGAATRPVPIVSTPANVVTRAARPALDRPRAPEAPEPVESRAEEPPALIPVTPEELLLAPESTSEAAPEPAPAPAKAKAAKARTRAKALRWRPAKRVQ